MASVIPTATVTVAVIATAVVSFSVVPAAAISIVPVIPVSPARRRGSRRISSSSGWWGSVTLAKGGTGPLHNNDVAVTQSALVHLVKCIFSIAVVFIFDKRIWSSANIGDVATNNRSVSVYKNKNKAYNC